ncbi:MAG: hypothetical protein ACXU93_13565, partial [Thermodesulfobacteriota bacterium]
MSRSVDAVRRNHFVPGSFDEKEITTAVPLRLSPLEMLYEDQISRNLDYKEGTHAIGLEVPLFKGPRIALTYLKEKRML